MLSELIYVSDRKNRGDEQEIKEILDQCQRNNSGIITGALLYSRTRFIQYLEGDYNDVKVTFDRINQDDRHSDVRLLVFSPIEGRKFPGWAMAEKNVDDDRINFQSQISNVEAEIFSNLLKGEISKKTNMSNIIRKFFD